MFLFYNSKNNSISVRNLNGSHFHNERNDRRHDKHDHNHHHNHHKDWKHGHNRDKDIHVHLPVNHLQVDSLGRHHKDDIIIRNLLKNAIMEGLGAKRRKNDRRN